VEHKGRLIVFKMFVFAIAATLTASVAVAGEDPKFDATDLETSEQSPPQGPTFECRKFQKFAMHSRKDAIEFDCVSRDGGIEHFALEHQYGRHLSRGARAKDLYAHLYDIKRMAIMNVILTFARSPNECSLNIETFDMRSGDRRLLAGVDLTCGRK